MGAAAKSKRGDFFGQRVDRGWRCVAQKEMRLAAGKASALPKKDFVVIAIDGKAEPAAAIAVDAGITFSGGDEVPVNAAAMPYGGTDDRGCGARCHGYPLTLQWLLCGACHGA